jgi:glycerol-3-phosphate acyltransferase PlsX
MTRIGYVFAHSAFSALRARFDPRAHNGGVFLGLSGLAVKSHGGTDATGFASALDLAVDMAAGKLSEAIADDMRRMALSIGAGLSASDGAGAAKAAAS